MANLEKLYDNRFYEAQQKESYLSALEVLSATRDLLPEVKSVIDVGCGVGSWLKAWEDIDRDIRIFGIDGSNPKDELYMIDKNHFRRVDFTQDAEKIMASLGFDDLGFEYANSVLNNKDSSDYMDSINAIGGGDRQR